jgi:UDP-N-acetylmuramoyl-tripeptide--D-alanyl-D-alanine ligase
VAERQATPADREGPSIPAALAREALGAPEVEGRVGEFRGVSIDSRALAPGSLFVAVKGERHDGNTFVGDAVRAGAAGVVAAGPPPEDHPKGVFWWRADDGGAALRRLALTHRLASNARVVCVTGTNGKTGTKELVAAVLATRFRVCRTPGNLNNQIGLPLSLLRLSAADDWGVFEIGTSQPGEIARLAAVAQPEVGVITNVAPSHLDGLSSLEGVVREKTDLAAALGREGTLVYGGDGELLRAAVGAFSCAKVSFGLGPSNDVHPERWELDEVGRPVFTAGAEMGPIRLQLVGLTNLLNALAAIAVGRLAGLTEEEIRRGLEASEPLPLRLQVERAHGVTVIQDCYNANPESVRHGVDTLHALGRGGARVAVLGGMRELGTESETLHYALGRELARAPLDLLLVYGEEAVALARGYQSGTQAPVFYFKDYLALARFLNRRVAAPAAVLFKASRGVALDQAAREYLIELRGEDAPGPEARGSAEAQPDRDQAGPPGGDAAGGPEEGRG